jgi:HK97 family phage portal protein
VPWHSVDGVTGISVIAQARNVIGSAIAMDKFGGRFFANDATPSGILSTGLKVKPEDKVTMRDAWETMQSGPNQHRVAVLDQELKFQQISIPNADSQWIENQKLSRESICGLFKILPSQIGDTARVAGETYAAQQMSFLTHTLRPWLNRISQELTRKLIPGLPQYSIVHDASDMLKLDFKTMMDGFAIARQWGILTSNEARLQLDLDPGPAECDLFWAPVNMFDAKRLLNPPTPTTVAGVENV